MPKGPRSKDTNTEIVPKDIAQSKDLPEKKDSGELAPMEPVFEESPIEMPEDLSAEIGGIPFKDEPGEMTSSKINKEIESLRPKVEDIAKKPTREQLSSEQSNILKKYISLKESEVRDLRDEQTQYQTFLKKLTHQFQSLQAKAHEYLTELTAGQRREDSLKREIEELKKSAQSDLENLKFEWQDKIRKTEQAYTDSKDLLRQKEQFKEQVREDLKRIKLKERELENRHELLKRDMQALLDSKDQQLLELKKRCDALELELESLEDRLRQNSLVLNQIQAKKRRLIETLKLAINLLDEIDQFDESQDPEKKVG